MEFDPVIGLEVHAQLNSQTKIFCGCSTRFGAAPNTNTCPVCLGLPGALPVLNEKVLKLALRASVALSCEVPQNSIFARKNYFYPDLPKGYQISQFDQPLAIHGHLNIEIEGRIRPIHIKRIHMEEDAGKLLHESNGSTNASYVDLNRAGVPLIEIVTEPDLHSPEEAYVYLKELKSILQFCDISEANMEEGNLRCDANVSLRISGSQELGTRVEIKNLNSFKNVAKALDYEIERQSSILAGGGSVVQETRLYDADRGRTDSMRSKEEAQDYRYFPDPDLPPVRITQKMLQDAQASLPELPEAKRRRFMTQYALSAQEAAILTEDRALAHFFEEAARRSNEPKQAANWILRDVLENMKQDSVPIQQSLFKPRHLVALLSLIRKNLISNTQAKEVFQEVWKSGKAPEQVVADKQMTQISNPDVIKQYIDQVFAENPDVVARWKGGESKLQGFLVGLVMKASGGKSNPGLVAKLVKERAKD
jgi:aspartyl-tRNA(Asn)/glutamyl-tRNA(Gln) amidotransferase subunit B